MEVFRMKMKFPAVALLVAMFVGGCDVEKAENVSADVSLNEQALGSTFQLADLESFLKRGMPFADVTKRFGPSVQLPTLRSGITMESFNFWHEGLGPNALDGRFLSGFIVIVRAGKVIDWEPTFTTVGTLSPQDFADSRDLRTISFQLIRGPLETVANEFQGGGSQLLTNPNTRGDLSLKAIPFGGRNGDEPPDTSTILVVFSPADIGKVEAFSREHLGEKILIAHTNQIICLSTFEDVVRTNRLSFRASNERARMLVPDFHPGLDPDSWETE